MGRYLKLAKTVVFTTPSQEIPLDARVGREGIKGMEGGPGAEVAAEASAHSSLICPCCQSNRFWKSIHGKTICAICHPPAAPQLVAELIDLNGEIVKVKRLP